MDKLLKRSNKKSRQLASKTILAAALGVTLSGFGTAAWSNNCGYECAQKMAQEHHACDVFKENDLTSCGVAAGICEWLGLGDCDGKMSRCQEAVERQHTECHGNADNNEAECTQNPERFGITDCS
jgi:hypothetical protein